MVGPHFFAGEEDMDCLAWPPLRTVKEHVHVKQFMVNEIRRLKCDPGGRKIGAAQQQIDIARVANGPFILARHPLGNRIASDHRVRHAGAVERPGGPAQTLLDSFRCHERPFPANRCDNYVGHEYLLLSSPNAVAMNVTILPPINSAFSGA